jgi:hypothetical protein
MSESINIKISASRLLSYLYNNDIKINDVYEMAINSIIKLLNDEEIYFQVPNILFYFIKKEVSFQKIVLESDTIQKLFIIFEKFYFIDDNIIQVILYHKYPGYIKSLLYINNKFRRRKKKNN